MMTLLLSNQRKSKLLHLLGLSLLCFALFGYSLPSSKYSPVAGQAGTAKLQEISKSLSSVAKAVSPAVVYVSVSKIPQASPGGYINPLDFFFGPGLGFPQQQQPYAPSPQSRKPVKAGVGSGFIIDLDRGYVATNNHVIEGADEIGLKLANGESYVADVVGRDPGTDIAVVQIKNKKFDRKGLTQLTLGDSDALEVGDLVIAMGAPFELEASLSFGVISALKRDIELGRGGNALLGSFIQTDAAINPGNSGGPLINMLGQAIGINTAIYSKSGGYNGIGFSVPSNLVRRTIEEIINNGSVSRGYLGVLLQDVDTELAKNLGLPSRIKGGALITKVADDGPAEDSGIKAGDVITEVDGRQIASDFQLRNAIGLKSPGKKVKITLYREGKKKDISLKLGRFPEDPSIVQAPRNVGRNWSSGSNQDAGFGLFLDELDRNQRQKLNLTSQEGALITDVAPNSPAARTGLQPGDLILGVNISAKNYAVESPKDFINITKGKSRVLIRIERQGKFFYVELQQ